MKSYLALVLLVLVMFPPAYAEQEQSADQNLAATISRLKEFYGQSKELEKQVNEAADEVRKAQADLSQSRGVLSPLLTQDRLRSARRKHHEASMLLKENRRHLFLTARELFEQVTAINQQLDQDLNQLEEEVLSNPEQRETASRRKAAVQERRKRIAQEIESQLGEVAPLIQQAILSEESPMQEGGAPFPPFPGVPPPGFDPRFPSPPSQEPGRNGRPPSGFSRGEFPSLQYHRRTMERMERRISELEQEVQTLRNRVEELESHKTGTASGEQAIQSPSAVE